MSSEGSGHASPPELPSTRASLRSSGAGLRQRQSWSAALHDSLLEPRDRPHSNGHVLISWYMVRLWGGQRLFTCDNCVGRTLQRAWFAMWVVLVGFGVPFSLFMVVRGGLQADSSWLAIEAMAIGCWVAFIYAVNYSGLYVWRTRYVVAWRWDAALAVLIIGLYAVIAKLYYPGFSVHTHTTDETKNIFETFHGLTTWARFGAAAIPTQAFFCSAQELKLTFRALKRAARDATNRKNHLRGSGSNFAVMTLRDRMTTSTSLPAGAAAHVIEVSCPAGQGPPPPGEDDGLDYINEFKALYERLLLFQRYFGSIVGVKNVTVLLAIVGYSISIFMKLVGAAHGLALTWGDLCVGSVIFGVTVLCQVSNIVASALTNEVQDAAMTVCELWAASPETVARRHPGFPRWVDQMLLRRELGFMIGPMLVDYRGFLMRSFVLLFTSTYAVTTAVSRVAPHKPSSG